MKRTVALFAVTLLLLVLQGTLLDHRITRADVATLVVVYLALERPVIAGAVQALVVGYLADVFAGTDRGLYAASLVIVFLAVRLLVSRLAGGRFLFVTVTCALATIGTGVISLGVERVVGPGNLRWSSVSPTFAPMLIAAAALGYPCYRLLQALDERFGEPEDDLVFRG